MTDIASEKLVRLTTFSRDGRPKHTPAWVTDAGGGTLGTTTDDDSWKVRRIRKTAQVEVTASDGRENVSEGVTPLSASATIIDRADPRYGQIESALIEKYGPFYKVFRWIRRVRGKKPCGVLVTLDGQVLHRN